MRNGFRKLLFFAVIIFTVISLFSLYSCSGENEDVIKWYYGEDMPDESTVANAGDFYLDFTKCDVYTFTDTGWKFAFNMRGDDGKNGKIAKNGSSWLSGDGKPKSAEGKNGDFFINTKSLTIYEKKLGAWNFVTRLSDERNYPYDQKSDSDGRLKILCIGNSYSSNTTQYVPNILRDLNIYNFDIGHLYIANCSVQRHYANLIGDATIYPEKGVQNYTYRLSNGGDWVTKKEYPIQDAVKSQNWDFIVIQHKSSGKLVPEDGDVEYYEKLVKEVKKYCPDAVFVWNMTWARSQEYENQIKQYEGIVENTQLYYSADGLVRFANPIGTAIQNARSSYLGDAMNSEDDKSHLNSKIGCYTAGLAFVGSITGADVSDVTWRPTGTNTVSEAEQKVAIESAVNALKNPFEVTESKYQTEP